MKKLLSLLLILCLIVSLAACGRNPGNEGPAENEQQAENNRPETTQPDEEPEEKPEQSGEKLGTFNINASLDETAEEETIHFDLSQYEQHGELSCGRIWCSIVEGDWDTPNEEWFAYFDCWGNQISTKINKRMPKIIATRIYLDLISSPYLFSKIHKLSYK